MLLQIKRTCTIENESNELPEKVKAISKKVVTKDLINKYSILNEFNYFYSGILKSYLVFIPVKNYVKYFNSTAWNNSWKSNGMNRKKYLFQFLLIIIITRCKS